MSAGVPTSSRAPGRRRLVLILIAAAGAWAALHLGLSPAGLIPSEGGLGVAGRFLSAAFQPALTYESDYVPAGAPPLLLKVLRAVWQTIAFAAMTAAVSTVVGLALGFFGSTAWWADETTGGAGPIRRLFFGAIAPSIYAATRLLIALMRSVHELLWAVLFMAASDLTPLAALIAIAIPYSGFLAKVFSEMVDEAPRNAAAALRAAGASPLQVYCFGLLPRALPDVLAYIIYRFECALRSSTVVGFFGITTLGYYIKQSFDELHYREVWTYLYALVLMIALIDFWSGALRRRLVT